MPDNDLHVPNEERRPSGRDPSARTKNIIPLAVILVILAGVAAFFLFPKKPAPVTTAPVTAPVEAEAARVPAIRHPLPQETEVPMEVEPRPPIVEKKPLPALDESDEALRTEAGSLVGPERAEKLFFFKAFIRHVVVTLDNLTNPKLPQRFGFTRPPEGGFTVTEDTYGDMYLDPKNYGRYRPYLDFAESVDSRKLVALYIYYYPLFQEAYESLGYPGRYFNDRLIEVIDHLLGAPVIEGPVKLVRPKVYYQFADPELEKLSAGRKIMIRIGPANAIKVKAKLREIRQILTGGELRQ